MKNPMEDWDACFRWNVSGCYFLTMAVLDLLDEGNKREDYHGGSVRSQVIMIGSVGGFSRSFGGDMLIVRVKRR
jgi:NAD(P)-dependent dehydrogenase (short-subunit alcohol dehydrogenase family)